MYPILYLLIFLFSLFIPHGFAAESTETGTLIVSYDTGPKGERLSRIRFILVNETKKEQMYPKAHACVENETAPSRMVAVENLPVGKYILKFLIPNADGLFEEVPERSLSISKGEVVRIDQSIRPRYATLKVKAKILPDDQTPAKEPVISLYDGSGNVQTTSITGKLFAYFLLPGKYNIVFEPLEGYRTPPAIPVEVAAGRVIGTLAGIYVREEPAASQNIEEVAAIISTPTQSYSTSGGLIVTQSFSQINVRTNLPQAHWSLLKDNVTIYSGIGSIANYRVVDGNNYSVKPDEVEGYTVRVSPTGTFSLFGGDTVNVDIFYERTYGTLVIQTPSPTADIITLTITPKDNASKPLIVKIKPANGKISWVSPRLPTGEYEVSYLVPPTFEPIPTAKVTIRNGERAQLNPSIIITSSIHIVANVPEAIFLLRTGRDSQIWKGEGREFTFRGLVAGTYQLAFATESPEYFIPPPEMRVFLSDKENKEIKVNFQVAGKITIHTNIERSAINIQEIGGHQKSYQMEMLERSKSLTLPQGHYRISLTPISSPTSTELKLFPPDPVEIDLHAFTSPELNLVYRIENAPPTEKERKLFVTSNVSAASFTVNKITGGKSDTIGHYFGKSIQITLPAADSYVVTFDDIPNYNSPEKITFELQAGEEKYIQEDYSSIQETISVPAGKAIIGNASNETEINESPAKIVNISAFEIGTYEVTNAQYAAWLSQAIKDKKIAYVEEADNRGKVLDMQGKLLFNTFTADPYSQISVQSQSTKETSFFPIPGKDSYPVINVSWYGAMAYCQDNHCRLPTEAEWEKAAGNDPQPEGKPLKKFQFGFSSDKIDPTWANYRDTDKSIQYFQVLTTPVGFYNGLNSLPLTIKNKEQLQTHLAKSPYGAFDMSGNVWEWVADWYSDDYYQQMSENDPKGPPTGTQKVAKGGCYDSLADGVRVSERLPLPPDHADAYTGFRIVPLK